MTITTYATRCITCNTKHITQTDGPTNKTHLNMTQQTNTIQDIQDAFKQYYTTADRGHLIAFIRSLILRDQEIARMLKDKYNTTESNTTYLINYAAINNIMPQLQNDIAEAATQ